MRLNDDEASAGDGLQQGEEKMCQTAGRESGLSSGSFTFIETLYLAVGAMVGAAVGKKMPESRVLIIM